MNFKRSIAVVLVDRANYGRMKPVMQCIKDHPKLHLITLCAGTMVLDRFGTPVNIVKKDGFKIDQEVFIEVEGSNPTTTAKTMGLSVIEFSNVFSRIRPDILLLIGDRFETLGAMIAASYQNICIAHIQGGEVSYTNDEVARHAMTKIAHYHFPATIRAAKFIEMMGENPQSIFPFGCPSVDIINKVNSNLSKDFFKGMGLGRPINPEKKYFLVIFHPVDTNNKDLKKQVEVILQVLESFQVPTLWLWPNIDSGSNIINKTIRMYHEYEGSKWLFLVKNLNPEDYQKVLINATCAIGNSSSFVREASICGTPTVLTGDRQKGREVGKNVIKCPLIDSGELKKSINIALHSQRTQDFLYGVSDVSSRITETLVNIELYTQKHLHYVQHECKINYNGKGFPKYELERTNITGPKYG